ENTRLESTFAYLSYNNSSIDTAGYFSDGQRSAFLAYTSPGDDLAALFDGGDVKITDGNLKVVGSAEFGDTSNVASGQNSVAMGLDTEARGSNSIAMGGWTTANGNFSTATGIWTSAEGDASVAMGGWTTARDNYSTALGLYTFAKGNGATALGGWTKALNSNATAMGYNTTAGGAYSTAMGQYTSAEAQSSLAIGRYNVGGGDPDNWVTADPLFEVGNGTSTANRSNALTVLKSGNVGIGIVTPEAKLHVVATTGSLIKGWKGALKVFEVDDYGYVDITNTAVKVSATNHTALNINFNPDNNFTSSYGIKVRNGSSAGSAGPSYGIYIDDVGQGVPAVGLHSKTTAGSRRYSGIFEGGNVGIGTLEPQADLHVEGDLLVTGIITGDGSGLYNLPSTSGGGWTDDGTVVRLVTITDKVGIGTAAPSVTLEVVGDVKIDGDLQVTGTIEGSSPVHVTGGLKVIGNAEIGLASVQAGANSLAVGSNSLATGSFSFAGGSNSKAKGLGSFATGNTATTETGALYSAAIGSVVVAGANSAVAMGYGSSAMGLASMALGYNARAMGPYSAAMGSGTSATGQNSFAVGNASSAEGVDSVAMGYKSTAGGSSSTALGRSSKAYGDYSFAVGLAASAEGTASAAMGKWSQAGHDNSFVWADSENAVFATTGTDQFLIRAAGGVGIGTNEPVASLEVNGMILGALPLTDVAITNGRNTDAYAAIMVGGVPSTGKVYLRSFETTTNQSRTTTGNWSAWVDFGSPEPAAKLISVSASIGGSNNVGYYDALITARTSSGNVYLRSFQTTSGEDPSNPALWSSWVSFSNPGF
ncbi:hypothetical protein ACFL4F_01795, partial [Candidatus Margulisiibacteriota bacterium]